MPRSARLIKPDFPHHVIQRGNRKMQVFFKDNDYQFYIDLLEEWCNKMNIDIWAYCLMPNHVHLVLVPRDTQGLSRALSQVHQRYTRMINKREDWSGYLWQGRFLSYVMDESYALSAVRYVELNPVVAGLVKQAEDYKWSSAYAHIHETPNALLRDEDLRVMVPNWKDYLEQKEHEHILKDLSSR